MQVSKCIAFFIMVAFNVGAIAVDDYDIAVCSAYANDEARLGCYDDIVKSIKKYASRKKPKTERAINIANSRLIELEKVTVLSEPADFSRDSKPYRAYIRASFKFRNNSKKTLTGLVYDVVFKDSFGKKLYSTTFDDQIRLPPNTSGGDQYFWYWEDNEFRADEPYDKMYSAATAGTIRFTVTLREAVFNDGLLVNLNKNYKK